KLRDIAAVTDAAGGPRPPAFCPSASQRHDLVIVLAVIEKDSTPKPSAPGRTAPGVPCRTSPACNLQHTSLTAGCFASLESVPRPKHLSPPPRTARIRKAVSQQKTH